MKFLSVAALGLALSLGACSSGDQAANADANAVATENLDQTENDAANAVANAEAAALGDQMNELNSTAPATDSSADPSDAQEQNVAGM